MATSLATSQSDTIMAKHSVKSIVWEYFGVEKGPNGRPTNLDVAICQSCHKSVKAKNGNTSNLLGNCEVTKAMKAKQTQKLQYLVQMSQLDSQHSKSHLKNVRNMNEKVKKWKDIILMLLRTVLLKTVYPYILLKNPGFKGL